MVKIHNTLTNKKEVFDPINKNRVNFFVCGPTVYGLAHIGNGKTFTQFDMIAKYLRYRGYDVYYLQNITDIDDKIIKKANESGREWNEVSKMYTEEFIRDMKSLGNDGVTEYAKATDYITQIVSQVKRLEEKGAAYRTSDGIYYEISKFKNYGKLSGRTEIQESDGVSRIDASNEKRGWNDFCLWKFSKEGEPFWETELGPGRPGWHIEDTAITEYFFGPQYDIHGGAIDLKMPHHEAEIAQMEMISGKSPLVRYWMHTGFLNTNNEKMSKSLDNFWTIRDVLGKYNFRVVRLMLLISHYRSSLEFSEEALEQNKNSLKRLDEFVFKIDPTLVNQEEVKTVEILREKVKVAMDDDFNTPMAMAHIFQFMTEANTKGVPGKAVFDYFREINAFFGFFEFQKTSDPEIESLINQRNEYRKAKDWEAADKIKQLLLEKGIKLYDDKDGTTWRKIEN